MEGSEEMAVIDTVHGSMTVRFWPDVAPRTVENFKKLSRQGFYDGTAFHRVVKDFMIQGGDPLSRDPGNSRIGTGGPGYTIPAEFSRRPHVRGVISMARSQDPDSAGSQFFICLAASGFLDGKYTAFGELVSGDEALEAIGATATREAAGGERSSPVERMGIRSIRIVETALA